MLLVAPIRGLVSAKTSHRRLLISDFLPLRRKGRMGPLHGARYEWYPHLSACASLEQGALSCSPAGAAGSLSRARAADSQCQFR